MALSPSNIEAQPAAPQRPASPPSDAPRPAQCADDNAALPIGVVTEVAGAGAQVALAKTLGKFVRG